MTETFAAILIAIFGAVAVTSAWLSLHGASR